MSLIEDDNIIAGENAGTADTYRFLSPMRSNKMFYASAVGFLFITNTAFHLPLVILVALRTEPAGNFAARIRRFMLASKGVVLHFTFLDLPFFFLVLTLRNNAFLLSRKFLKLHRRLEVGLHEQKAWPIR